MPVTAKPVTAERRHRAAAARMRRHRLRSQIAALLRGFSVGATAPAMARNRRAETGRAAARHRSISPPSRGRPYGETIEAAVRVRASGLEPVPHLAARDIESHDALDDVLSRLTRWAGVQRMLIVGGDAASATGPFGSALELIESGLLQRARLREIAIAAIRKAIRDCRRTRSTARWPPRSKPRAQTGLGVSIVTQLCFDADAVLGWVRRLRDLGIEQSGPDRHGGTGGSLVAAPPRAPLRRPRLGADADAPRRADQASARRRHARPRSSGRSPKRRATARSDGCRAFLCRRGRRRNRALGAGRGGGRLCSERRRGGFRRRGSGHATRSAALVQPGARSPRLANALRAVQ